MRATYRIADVARRSGFKASTLRYYEELGLVRASARTPAGYRVYDESTLARLAFIARAKQLGCSLEEIQGLAAAWEGERCQPIQLRLRDLIDAKIAEAEKQVAEMSAFIGQLHQAAASLGAHTPEGACDATCGCSGQLEPSLLPLRSLRRSGSERE
jgi:DNA-binding transcriptional MerR regulator